MISNLDHAFISFLLRKQSCGEQYFLNRNLKEVDGRSRTATGSDSGIADRYSWTASRHINCLALRVV